MDFGVYFEILKNIVNPDDVKICSQVNKTFRLILINKLKLVRCLYQLKQKFKYNPFLLIFKNHISCIYGKSSIPWDFFILRTNQIEKCKKNNKPDYRFGIDRCSLILRLGIKWELRRKVKIISNQTFGLPYDY